MASNYDPQLVAQVLTPYIELIQFSFQVKLFKPTLGVPCFESAADGQCY